MKTAKELFEELGYKLDTIFSNNEYITYKKKENDGFYAIDFDIKHKTVRVSFVYTRGIVRTSSYATLDELKVINKQIEELNWNE